MRSIRRSPVAIRGAVSRGMGAAVAACAVLVTGVVVAPAAEAVEPATPVFPRAIDAYASYEAETGCDPTAKPGALSVQSLIHATYGSRPSSNISRSCTSSSSGHEEGRAIDWMTNSRDAAQKATADSFISWLLATDQYGNRHAMARRLGVAYIIWDSRKLYLWNTSAGWTQYSDCLTVRTAATYDNTCHRNHVHISLSWAGANRSTTWYTLAGDARGPCPAPGALAQPSLPTSSALGYIPVTPARLLDTRDGFGAPYSCWVGANAKFDLQVLGRGGVPSSGVAAVTLNVTAVDARAGTWVGAHPGGSTHGGTSSVNVVQGGTAASLVTVPLGTGGRVSFSTGGGGTDLVVDVVGYYPTDGAGSRYQPLSATRLTDAALSGQSWTTMPAAVPADATAVVANVTADSPAGPGYLTLRPGPASGAAVTTSTVNHRPGRAVANRAVVGVADGQVSLFASTAVRGIVDMNGYFGATGARYHVLPPTRAVDSRNGTGSVAPLAGGVTADVLLGGQHGIPRGASAVVATVTLDASTATSHLTVWQRGSHQPPTSDLNVAPGSPIANLVVMPLDRDGLASLQLSAGRADVIIDVLGYYDMGTSP